jgi:threonine dehydratase
VTRTPSFVDAIGTPEVLKDVFEALEPLVAGARVVTIRQAEAAVARLFRADRLVVEGAGACAFAAAADLAREGRGRVVAILSGANLEESTLLDILRRHGPVWA